MADTEIVPESTYGVWLKLEDFHKVGGQDFEGVLPHVKSKFGHRSRCILVGEFQI
jgi:hypothetical protein